MQTGLKIGSPHEITRIHCPWQGFMAKWLGYLARYIESTCSNSGLACASDSAAGSPRGDISFLRYTLRPDQVSAAVSMLLEASEDKDVEANLPEEAEDLSHFIVYFLDIREEREQQFLELTSTRQRLREEITILRREVPFMCQIPSKGFPEDITHLN